MTNKPTKPLEVSAQNTCNEYDSGIIWVYVSKRTFERMRKLGLNLLGVVRITTKWVLRVVVQMSPFEVYIDMPPDLGALGGRPRTSLDLSCTF